MDTIVLLDLMGGVALLLWGLHMVRSGILRAFGSDLRRAAKPAGAGIQAIRSMAAFATRRLIVHDAAAVGGSRFAAVRPLPCLT